jgi:RecA-family ATPase
VTEPPIDFGSHRHSGDDRRRGDENGAHHGDDPPRTWQSLLVSPPDEWFDKPPPARSWLLRDRRRPKADGFLPLGKVGQLIAKGGAGKTMLAFQLAIAVATGTPWLGTFDVATQGRVLVVVGEEDRDEVQRRLYNARRAAKAPKPPKDSIVVLPLAGQVATMLDRDAVGNPHDAPFLTELRVHVEANGPFALIIIDPLSRFAGLDAEKDNALATRFVQCLESLVTITGATVLVFHHTNQASRSKGGEVEDVGGRGVTALIDGPRWQVSLGIERLAIEDPDARERLGELLILAHTKTNYTRKADPLLLRRDLDNGGALVPLDERDLRTVEQSRAANPVADAKRARRATERAERETAAAKAKEEQRHKRELAGEAARERVDAIVRQCMAEGLTGRALRVQVKARAHVGTDVADTAIARCRPPTVP